MAEPDKGGQKAADDPKPPYDWRLEFEAVDEDVDRNGVQVRFGIGSNDGTPAATHTLISSVFNVTPEGAGGGMEVFNQYDQPSKFIGVTAFKNNGDNGMFTISIRIKCDVRCPPVPGVVLYIKTSRTIRSVKLYHATVSGVHAGISILNVSSNYVGLDIE